MDYVVNAQADPQTRWVNKGNVFLKSKYGAAIYIIALIIVVILYYFGMDFSGLKNSVAGLFNSNTYTSTTSNNKTGVGKSSTIIVGIAALLVFIGIVLYLIRLYNYNNTLVIPLVDRVADGKNFKLFDKLNLPPSTNRSTGAEFAYSTWIRINDWTYNATVPKYILVKGKLSNSNNIMSQSPSIYLTTTNTLRVATQTYGGGLTDPLLTETVELADIPLKRWFHLLVASSGRNMDIYINGILVKRATLDGIVVANNEPVYICPAVNSNGSYSSAGFGGLLYKFNYYSYYPSQDEILNMIENIPEEDAAPCK
jgi:hypothetical protein